MFYAIKRYVAEDFTQRNNPFISCKGDIVALLRCLQQCTWTGIPRERRVLPAQDLDPGGPGTEAWWEAPRADT